MAAEEQIPESISRGKNGKYQIRIESYDPARNTMKAIWLVARSEKTLANLLEKCDVSETGTTDEDLRGNLLSVQRELEELREAMDRTDGTQTPTIDASFLTRSRQMNDLDSFSGSFRPAERVLDRSEGEREAIMVQRPASAAPALDFGLAKRKRVFLSQIPLYSRPSIRTDFCVCPIDPFPEIRMLASKIPRAPKKSKTTVKKTSKASKKQNGGPMSRPKTSLGNSRPAPKTVSSKKTSMGRPATSMALSRSLGVERTQLDNSIDERMALRGCKTIVLDAKGQKQQRRDSTRAASSLGGGGIPRSSSRLSTFGTRTPSINLSGRHSAMSGSTSSTSSSYMQMYLASKSSQKGQNCTTQDHTAKSNEGKKGQSNGVQNTRESKGKRTQRPKSSMESTKALNSSSQVLSFEPPSSAFSLDSQSVQGLKSDSKIVESSPDRSASPLIGSVSIIDDLSEGGESRESNTNAPRMLLGEAKDPEYQAKAFFHTESSTKGASLKTQGSAIIPSSPVEVADDSTHDQDDKTRDVYIHYREIVGDEQKESNATEQSKVTKGNESEKTDFISSKKDINWGSGSTEQESIGVKEDQTDFGFLEEFGDEVSGLLDSLMSQDLQAAFTAPELQSPPEDSLPSLNVSETPQTKEAVEDTEEQPVSTTINEVQSTPTEDSVDTQTEVPVQNEEEEVPEEENQDSVVEELEEGGLSVQREDVRAQDSSETAPTELSESAIDSDHPSIVQEDNTEEKVPSKRVTDEHSAQDPVTETTIKTSKKAKTDRKQRKSTGIRTLPSKRCTRGKTQNSALRRARSQSGLESVSEHSVRQEPSKAGMNLEVEGFWSERNGAFFETELCNFDRLDVSETSLTFSGSELTMPDCCETYSEKPCFDFCPGLAPTQTHSNAFDNALEEFENSPYSSEPSSVSMMDLFGQSIGQATMETPLTDKRRFSAPLSEDCLTKMEDLTDASKSFFTVGLQSCPHFSWLDPSGPVTLNSEEKPIEEEEKPIEEVELPIEEVELPIEEVEQPFPISELHYLKDNRFSSTGSRLSWYWGSSESDASVTVPGTDVDTIEDSQDESTCSTVDLCAALGDEESRANNVELHQERLSPGYKLHIPKGESSIDPFDINDILSDVSMPQTNEVVVEVQQESKRRKRLSLSKFLRFITCSKTLKRMAD